MDTPFRTPKTDEAAAIVASGGKLVGLNRRSHRTVEFLLAPTDLCRRSSEEFYRGTLLVNARQMAEALKNLKDAIFANLNYRDKNENPFPTHTDQ